MTRAGPLSFGPSLALSILPWALLVACESDPADGLGGPEVDPPPTATDACQEQRSPEATGNPLDIAALAPAHIPLDNGRFVDSARLTVGAEGFLVNENGERLLGVVPATNLVEPLPVPLEIPAEPTESVRASVLLTTYRAGENPSDSGAPLVGADEFDPNDPGASSFFSFAVEVFDSTGMPHDVDVYFSRVGPRDFAWRAVADTREIDPMAAAGGQVINSGLLIFESDGRLRHNFTRPAGVQFFGAEPQLVNWDFAMPAEDADEITFAAGGPSRVLDSEADGHPSLSFNEISVDGFGWVRARYGEAVWESIGFLVVAKPAMGCLDMTPLGPGDARTVRPEAGESPSLGFPGAEGFERLIPGVRWKSVALDVAIPEARCDQQEPLQMSSDAGDLAVSGGGYLALAGRGFARALRVVRAEDGRLTAPDGTNLLGFAEATPNTAGPLTLPLLESPEPTALVGMTVNLDANAAISGEFDLSRPTETSFWSTELSIFDALGRTHPTTIYFTRTGAATYQYTAAVDASRLVTTSTGALGAIAAGELVFTTDGRLQAQRASMVSATFFGSEPRSLAFQFGAPLSDGGDGSGSTATSAPSEASLVTTDGFAVGQLVDFAVDTDGRVTARYDSGREVVRGALALGSIADPCTALGWPDAYGIQSLKGGTSTATLGRANTDGRGRITQGAILVP